MNEIQPEESTHGFVPVEPANEVALQQLCDVIQRRLRLASPDDVLRLSVEELEAALGAHAKPSWTSRTRAAMAAVRTGVDLAIVTGRIFTVITVMAQIGRVVRIRV
jgi:hypothetical protein